MSVDFKILKSWFDVELNSSFYVHSKRLLFFILFIDPQIQNFIPHYCYDDLKNTSFLLFIYISKNSKDLEALGLEMPHILQSYIHGIN